MASFWWKSGALAPRKNQLKDSSSRLRPARSEAERANPSPSENENALEFT